MMKKLLLLFTALTFSVSLWAQTAPAGAGTKDDPYQITSYEQLKWFSAQVNQGGDYVFLCAKLMNDIQGSLKRTDGTAYTDVFTPIGRSNAGGEFCGDFDGNGHIIRDMMVGSISPAPANIGLIGKMIAGSRVHHVGLVDCAFGGSSYVGCLCGDFADGEIDHCFVQGCSIMYTASTIGGLVGSCFTYAKLHDCYCSCAMTKFSLSDASNDIGALCGASNATIINCYGEVKESVPGAAIGRTYGTSTTKNVVMKQTAAFASGEVCYLLNSGVADGSQAWYQTLGTDIYPTWDKNHGTVYATKGASGMVYTNTKPQTPTTYHPQSEPTCEQRGYAQECWEDEATGKLYADALCTRELNPAVVIRYAPLAISQVFGNPGDAYEIKETVTFKGVPFSWAAVRRYSEMSAGENTERRDLEFTAHDYPTDARLKFYKSETTREYGLSERFTITVDVYTSGKETLKSRNSIVLRGEEMLSYFSLNGLQKGDIVYVTVYRNLETVGYLSETTDLAFALEYCSAHCGADDARITIMPTSSTNSFRKVLDTHDPEFGYKVEGKVYSAYPLKDITVTREPGETPGTYKVSVSCPEGANPVYDITFRTAEFTIADATFHKKAAPVDCGHTGVAMDYWEWNGKYYPDASLNPEQVLSEEQITAYPKLKTPYLTPISGSSEWEKSSLIMKGRPTETAEAILTAYGTNIKDARLTITWGGTSKRERHLQTTMKIEYKGQTQERELEVDTQGPATSPIYFPLEGLQRGDKIKVSCTPPYGGDFEFYVTFNLEYLSNNCGDESSLVPLTITGTPAVSSKEWDGTTEVEQSAINLTNCQLVGIDAADEGKVQLTATATYDNAEVGNNHTVTLTYGILVTDEILAGKYQLDETVELVTVTNVPITYPQTVTDTKDAAKQALADKAGEQPSTEVQAIVTEYNGKIDNVALSGSVRAVIEAIEMIKTEGLSMINSQQSIEQYQRDLAAEKTAAKQALTDKVGDTDNKDINNLVTEYSNQIDMQTTIKDVQDVRDEGLLAIENALKYYNAGQANALGTLGTKQDGPAVEVIKDEEKVILYNPEQVNFIKVSTPKEE